MQLVTQPPHPLSSLKALIGMKSYKVEYRVGGVKRSHTLQLQNGSREEASNELRKQLEVPREVGIIILSIEPSDGSADQAAGQ